MRTFESSDGTIAVKSDGIPLSTSRLYTTSVGKASTLGVLLKFVQSLSGLSGRVVDPGRVVMMRPGN
jgi:hypothetical protein